MLFKKPKLYEVDPKTLDIETLLHLRAALTAKLLLVNREVQNRSAALTSLAAEVPNAEVAVFRESADFAKGFGVVLEAALEKFANLKNSN